MSDQFYEDDRPLYQKIYEMVSRIPPGKVATYGQIARLVGGCTARMVGYAMSAVKQNSGVPWQRVINAQGKISSHGDGFGTAVQRALLELEGIEFNHEGRVDFEKTRWSGPQSGKIG